MMRSSAAALVMRAPRMIKDEQKGDLIWWIEFWAKQTPSSFKGLPDGLFQLRN
jgi:hypothetical protein